LEIKYACETAEDVGAKLEFLGNELNKETWGALFHETRFSVPYFFFRWWRSASTRWAHEQITFRQKIAENGIKTFTEACLDQY
jgi:hypothetical protein